MPSAGALEGWNRNEVRRQLKLTASWSKEYGGGDLRLGGALHVEQIRRVRLATVLDSARARNLALAAAELINGRYYKSFRRPPVNKLLFFC